MSERHAGRGARTRSTSVLALLSRGERARVCLRAPTSSALKGRYLGREKGLLPALFARLKELPPAGAGRRSARASTPRSVEIEEAIGRLGAGARGARGGRARRRGGRRRHAAGAPPARGRAPPDHDRAAADRGHLPADGLLDRRRPRGRERLPQLRGAELPARASGARHAGHAAARPQGGLAAAPADAHVARPDPGDDAATARRSASSCPGRVYRKDEVDATHSPVFHQVEGARRRPRHLDGGPEGDRVGRSSRSSSGRDTKARFIPTFFPFVEPGVDVAMSCIFCKGAGCRKCKGSGWIEIMGAGMVHPRVLQGVGDRPRGVHGLRLRPRDRPRGAPEVRLPGPAPALRGRRAVPLAVRGARMKFSLDWLGDFVDVAAAGGAEGVRAPARPGRHPGRVGRPPSGEDTILDVGDHAQPAGRHGPPRPRARDRRDGAACSLRTSARGTPSLAAEGEATERLASIVIQVPRLCRRFGARVVRGIGDGPAAGARPRGGCRAIGAKSISAAVDATNYVLWDTGQPLHAFDFDKLAGELIIVRKARAGEKLVTLDGVERTLDPSDIVVADAERAVSLAGIMGGLDTAVTGADEERPARGGVVGPGDHPQAPRAGSGCTRTPRTASSGAPITTRSPASLDLAARLLVEAAGGTVAPGLLDAHGAAAPRPQDGAAPRRACACSRATTGSTSTSPRRRSRASGSQIGAPGQAPHRVDPALPRRRAPRGRPRRGSPARLRLRPAALAPAARPRARRATRSRCRQVEERLADAAAAAVSSRRSTTRSSTATPTSRPGATGCA